MKKRLFLTCLTLFSVIVLFTGCIHQDIEVKINKQNGGTITASLGIKKDMYNKLVADGQDPFEGMDTFEYNYNGSKYIAYSETKSYSTYRDLSSALMDMSYNTDFANIDDTQNVDVATNEQKPTSAPTEDEKAESKDQGSLPIFESVTITKKQFLLQAEYTFEATFNAHNIENNDKTNENVNNELDIDYNLNDIYRFSLSIEMPGSITAHREGTINGNEISFDITDISEKQTISVKSQTSCDYIIYTAIIVLGILAILVICIVVASKPREEKHGSNK